ncbi:MAG: DUF1361 domain-containing protein [Chitinophagaceae bacterium]
MTKILQLPAYLFKMYTLKSEIDRLLFLSVCFSTFLLIARVFYTGSLYFVSLEWNLFLAFVPYSVSTWMFDNPQRISNKWLLSIVVFVWILFIPNSFYIITDLFHLGENGYAPLWYDLLLLLSFAWNGLMMGILSVRQMEKIMQASYFTKHELLFVYPVMWLNALGVFIGRYWRLNSWDVITNPFRLIIDILDLIMHPLVYKNAWAMIFTFSVFMTLLYLTIKRISRIIW